MDAFLNSIGQQNGDYVQVMGLVLPIGGLVWPWITGPIVEKYGLVGGSFALCIGSVVMETCRLIPVLQVQVVGFVALTFFRALQFALLPSFMSTVFGQKHMGTLIGASVLIAGILSALQYVVYSMLWVMSVVCYVHVLVEVKSCEAIT